MLKYETNNQSLRWFARALARLRTRSDYGSLELFVSFSFQEKKKNKLTSRQKENKEASEEKETMNCISSYNKESWLPF